MIDPKLLTEKSWKDVVVKYKVKDNGLQKALATYDRLGDDQHDECLKVMAVANTCANNLKKVKGPPDVLDHLTDLIAAIQNELRELAKAKAEADKAAKAAATSQKKTDAAAKDEEEEEEEEGEHRERLIGLYNKLKSSKEAEYHFAVCDAKPYCGLVISKVPIAAKHKAELTEITGGSKKFLKPGTCWVENGKLVFDMEDAPPGMAGKLKKAFKYFTGLNIGVMVGDETDEDEGEESGQHEHGGETPLRPVSPALEKAPELWAAIRNEVGASIDALKVAIRKEFAGEGRDILAGVEKDVKGLDRVFDTLGDDLGACLARARAAKDGATQEAELRNAKGQLARTIQYLKTEKLIAHIDANPFGVKTDLRAKLTSGLTEIAKAV
jgi:hypothetical protein